MSRTEPMRESSESGPTDFQYTQNIPLCSTTWAATWTGFSHSEVEVRYSDASKHASTTWRRNP